MLSRLVITFLPRSKCLLISWLLSPSAVILELRKIQSATVSSSICHEVMGRDAMKWWDQRPWSSFSECWVLSQPFHSTLSLSSGGSLVLPRFLPYTWCNLHIWGNWLLCINKQGDNIQPWRTPFPIWSQSVFSCPVLTIASSPAYRFLKMQVRWSGTPISLRIFHNLLWST